MNTSKWHPHYTFLRLASSLPWAHFITPSVSYDIANTFRSKYKELYFGTLIISVVFLISSCAGTHSYPNRVLAGETITIGAGWKHNFSQRDVSVQFIPEVGPDITYPPGDPAIRAVLNLYPDPLSSIVISQRTGEHITSGSLDHAGVINFAYTDYDNDWWQTAVFIDVPAALPVGEATVIISNQEGDQATSTIDVVGSGGIPDDFKAENIANMTPQYFDSISRLDHYIVSFTGSVLPAGIELELSAIDFIGYVTQGRGEATNLSWHHDDINNTYKVLLTQSYESSIQKLQDYKFYVAITGGIASTASLDLIGNVSAYDSDGNDIAGVNAVITYERGIYGLIN